MTCGAAWNSTPPTHRCTFLRMPVIALVRQKVSRPVSLLKYFLKKTTLASSAQIMHKYSKVPSEYLSGATAQNQTMLCKRLSPTRKGRAKNDSFALWGSIEDQCREDTGLKNSHSSEQTGIPTFTTRCPRLLCCSRTKPNSKPWIRVLTSCSCH